MSTPLHIPAADGYPLGGFAWRHPPGQARALLIVNSATSVRCRYYARFAQAMHAQGLDVLTYDYRGIGESRTESLRTLRASWLDWGENDFEGVLRHALTVHAGQDIYVVGHSVGGMVVGMAPSAHRIARIFTMGAQFAYWRDYAPAERTRMRLQWHWLMPMVVRLAGYMPAKRLGWMEDTPKGVAMDWARMGPRFEHTLLRADASLAQRFAQVRAPTLALGVEDDAFGTEAAIERLLAYYSGCERHHLRLKPEAVGEARIGHFAFFHPRFQATLWPMASNWLLRQTLPEPPPGALHSHLPNQAITTKNIANFE